MRTSVFQRSVMLLLCLSMLLTMTLPISAEQSTTVSATVIARNAPSYHISIPATIEVTELSYTAESTVYSKEFDVTVSDLSAMNGTQITLRLYTGEHGFYLCNDSTGSLLPFAVHGPITPDTPLQSGDVFARFAAEKTETGSIRIDRKDILASGIYTGSILFSISRI